MMIPTRALAFDQIQYSLVGSKKGATKRKQVSQGVLRFRIGTLETFGMLIRTLQLTES